LDWVEKFLDIPKKFVDFVDDFLDFDADLLQIEKYYTKESFFLKLSLEFELSQALS
jgi:hypothetical protein